MSLLRRLLGNSHDDWPLTGRLVVFDLETTGLNPRKDRLLSIGAVALIDGRIILDDCFHAELQPPVQLAADNVLIHRLTPDRLQRGEAVGPVLRRFVDYIAGAPLLAYHAAFDHTLLKRALQRESFTDSLPPALDVAQWVMAAAPGIGSRPPTLDVALGYFRIPVIQRHDALADALITARLCLVLHRHSLDRGLERFGQLRRVLAADAMLRQAR